MLLYTAALAALVARLRARCGTLARYAGPGAEVASEELPPADPAEPPICCICIECITRGDSVLVLPCAHAFHRDCATQYLADPGARTCPLCRAEIEPAQLAALVPRPWQPPTQSTAAQIQS